MKYPKTFFYASIFILFFIDICCSSFFEKQLIYSLLCFYSLAIFKSLSLFNMLVFFFILSLESFFQYGYFGIQLIYLAPLTLLASKTIKTLYLTKIQAYLFITISLLAQSLIIDQYTLHMDLQPSYTIAKIFVNLILVMVISLKY